MLDRVKIAIPIVITAVAGVAFAQTSHPGKLDDVLSKKVEFAIQWTGFWDLFWASYVVPNYTPGLVIPAKVVESPYELAVILSTIRTCIVFRRAQTGETGGLASVSALSRSGNDTPDADVRDYIRRKTARLDPAKTDRFDRSDPRKSSQAPAFDSGQFTYLEPPVSPESIRVSDAEFQLRPLTPPAYITQRIRPAGLDQLVAAVTQNVQRYMASGQISATVIIPYFSADDPGVNVFVDFHQIDSGEAVLWMTANPTGAGWFADKLTLNRGQEDLNPLIGTIREVKLVEFRVSPK